jgi:hypothetical protein
MATAAGLKPDILKRTTQCTFQPNFLTNASTVSDRNNCEMFFL